MSLAACTTATPAPTTLPILEPPVVSDPSVILDQYLDRVLLRVDRGSAMLSVFGGGGEVTYAARGSDPDGDRLTPQAPVRIGGVAAAFAEATALVLAQEGRIDLDARVVEYVGITGLRPEATVRDLIGHEADIQGYAMSFREGEQSTEAVSAVWPSAQTLDAIAGQIVRFSDGRQWTFPVAQTHLLAAVIESAAGRPLDEVIRDALIDPLALESTYFAGSESGPAPLGGFTGRRPGFDNVIPADYTSMSWTPETWTAGAMISDAVDLHTLFQAAYEGGLLSPESLDIWSGSHPSDAVSLTDRGTFGYADEIAGFTTVVFHSPANGSTAVLMLTTDSAYYDDTIPLVSEYITRG